jgi:predicted AlkP superfamily phosphohydrolase/phosphomutase
MRVDRVLVALIVVVFVAAAVIAVVKVTGSGGGDEPAPVVHAGTGDLSLLVIGIQGLERSMVERLTSEGRLPNIGRLISDGATGTFETLGRNVDARITWTSLVTGMLPENQGVGGKRLSRRGEMVDAPLTPQARTVGALWTYLGDAGERSGVLCWPGTWPVEEIEGIMVGPHSTYTLEREHGGNPAQAISPISEHERIDPMMMDKARFERRDLSRFVNEESDLGLEALVGQNYEVLSSACAGDRSVVDIADMLAFEGDVQNLFVCLAGVDQVSQRFWHYMDTEAIEVLDVDEDAKRFLMGQIEALGETVESYYDYVDELVGELVDLLGEDGTVVIVADHGYAGIQLDSAGMPLIGAHMHSDEGLWIAAGPRVAAGAAADRGRVIDVAPTIMAAAGMQVPDTLDGAALEEIIVH